MQPGPAVGAGHRSLDDLLSARTEANQRFFSGEADRVARLCHRMAERFARGGRLVAFGRTPAARSDARHVAVEFVHPVIVGKRALPALGLAPEGGDVVAQVELAAEPDDIAIAFGLEDGDPEVAGALRAARARGCMTIAFAPDPSAEWAFEPPGDDPFVRQELGETLYHVLWELVHVFFEHRGLLEGRAAEPVHDTGASSFLYPFLAERETDLEAVVADVRDSVLLKAEDVGALREQTLTDGADELLAAAATLRASFDAQGKLLCLGNGGSATDAMDAAADFRDPPAIGAAEGARSWPARRALDLTEDPAILTAIANDIGVEAIFARQIIALGREGDAVLTLSTSGNSVNVIAALAEARRRGLRTVAMVGYDGGRIAAERLADHVVITRSEHLPRIQEAQASAYHALRELVESAVVEGTCVSPLPAARRRVRARVEGTVQGVGFRPHVYRLSRELDLAGYVLNDNRGVLLEVEGAAAAVDRFLERLSGEAPPLAEVERVRAEDLPATGASEFTIVESDVGGQAAAPVSPDTATCSDCLAELFDPADRRYRYPFVNCTNCGPRFTIVRGVPYDRPLTTMAGFAMCARCRAEYEDPGDRRFHAQPNACPVCGPAARLTDAAGDTVALESAPDAVAAAAAALAAGSIVAVKGLGGFHLACRADDEAAVATLRARKRREEKPFALMVADLAAARELVELAAAAEELLRDRARPIVLARRRPEAPVGVAVAPRSDELGLMLPYSPLHHLLLADAGGPLVMTSGNVSDEPIAYRDEDALERLGAIADLFLLHDRPIETRTDDSVVRAVAIAGRSRRPLTLRRSRGYVPASLALPVPARRHLLACGAELKNTFCVAKDARAWVGHHIGDLENWETLRSFREGIAHFERLFAVEPAIVAHDLHPDYLSTAYALEREDVALVGVQHHHAHLAACLAEHGETGPAVGAIYDGTGLGTDGTVWGGELLAGDLAGFERSGHLWPVRMPGGERAIREPWRMACAWLVEALGPEPQLPAELAADGVDADRWAQVARLVRGELSAPVTTSLGRLFDAVSALCGICLRTTYEGQAAIELEAAAAPGEHGAYPLPARSAPGEPLVLDARETIRAVVDDLGRGVAVATVAARFHDGLADATTAALIAAAEARDVSTAVLSGGAFANRRLLERTAADLVRAGLRVLVPERLPPGDGGISFGQAAVAAAKTARSDDAAQRGRTPVP